MPSLTRRPRAAAPADPTADPEPTRVVWADPDVVARFAVHDAGASGQPYPELVRDGAAGRAARNAELLATLAAEGWRTDDPAVLHVDRATGLARLRDGNHRTHFARAAGLACIPVLIAAAPVPNRLTSVAHPYRGEFDTAPTVQ